MFSYERLHCLTLKIFYCKHRIHKVCLQCVFFYVQLSHLTVKICCCKDHIHKAYLQYVFSYGLLSYLIAKLKKQNCDFKHPQYSHRYQPSNRVPKHRMHCPFLRRKGFCLKGNQCDFLRSDSSNTHPTQGFDLSYLNPFLSYTQRTASPNLMQFHQRSNNTQVPLDFPMTSWPTHPWIQPLMNTPICPPRLR